MQAFICSLKHLKDHLKACSALFSNLEAAANNNIQRMCSARQLFLRLLLLGLFDQRQILESLRFIQFIPYFLARNVLQSTILLDSSNLPLLCFHKQLLVLILKGLWEKEVLLCTLIRLPNVPHSLSLCICFSLSRISTPGEVISKSSLEESYS